MQSRISGHSNGGRGKKGAWNWDATLCSRCVVTVSSLKGRVAEREREREERKRDRIIVRGPQRYLLHVWGREGGERKNHNGQLGYKLHQPLCGSLNDVSSKEGRGIGPYCWKRRALTFLFLLRLSSFLFFR